MKILFVGANYYPAGGAEDLAATDVNIEEGLQELLEAFRPGNDWWHIYCTDEKKIIDQGRF